MNADEILRRATSGTLIKADQDMVAEALLARDPKLDRYTLLLSLGRAMARQHSKVVESYLNEEHDPMLARLALQILCKFWSGTVHYLPIVERALDGLAWDEEDDVRQMALSIAGEYLREAEYPRFLEQLLDAVEDETEDDVIRKDAYLSLARAMGVEWDELPPLSRLPPLDEFLDKALVRSAEMRLQRVQSV